MGEVASSILVLAPLLSSLFSRQKVANCSAGASKVRDRNAFPLSFVRFACRVDTLMEDIFALDDADVEIVSHNRQHRSASPEDSGDYEVPDSVIRNRASEAVRQPILEPQFNFDYQKTRQRPLSPRISEPFNLGLDEEVVVKQRAPQAKLDDTRLLGPSGIPKIRDNLRKKIKIRGKGHELQDLSIFIEQYQFWAHELFPKAKFRDALKMIRKVGKTTTMKSQRRGIITDFLPKPVEEEPESADDDEESVTAAAPVVNKGVENYFDDEFELSDLEDGLVHGTLGARPAQGLQGTSNDIPDEDPVAEVDDVDDLDALEAMGVTI